MTGTLVALRMTKSTLLGTKPVVGLGWSCVCVDVWITMDVVVWMTVAVVVAVEVVYRTCCCVLVLLFVIVLIGAAALGGFVFEVALLLCLLRLDACFL